MNMTLFNMSRDINGFNAFGLPISNKKYKCLLSQNVESTLVVPETGNSSYKNVVAIFSFDPGDSVWVSVNSSATLPTTNIFSETNSELNPTARLVKPGDILSFITTDQTDQVGVVFYATL
jgi:hypothetical protein